MLKWLEKIFRKKDNPAPLNHTCDKCVYWKSEEENNAPMAEKFSQFVKYPGEYRFCDVHKEYTHKIHTCSSYVEEKFEPHSGSISSEELSLDLESVIEKVVNESEPVDPEI